MTSRPDPLRIAALARADMAAHPHPDYSDAALWVGAGYLDPRAPEAATFRLVDIARGLSRRSRYAGHTTRPWSVAQHSLAVANMAARLDLSLDLEAVALLHDAAEAFFADIPAPLKRLPEMAPYRRLEDALQAAIFAAFGLTEAAAHWRDLVAGLDRAAMYREKRDLIPATAARWPDVPVVIRGDILATATDPDDVLQKFCDVARFLGLPLEGRADV